MIDALIDLDGVGMTYEVESGPVKALVYDAHRLSKSCRRYPMSKFGPTKRAPLSEVVYRDRWGES